MAFTLAHPAAIIPLRNLRYLDLTPLIIGSMTPDLVGLLPQILESKLPYSHSPIGTVLVDLPVGYLLLLSLLIFRHALLRPLWEPHRAVIEGGLDDFFARRHHWLIALPSLLIASWTHIVWDRFTHNTAWTYRNLPFLYRPLFPEAIHQLTLFHALQYITSILGLIFLGWCYWRHLQLVRLNPTAAMTAQSAEQVRRKVMLLLIFVVIALAAGFFRLGSAIFEIDSVYRRLSVILKTALVCFGFLYFMSGLALARAEHRS